MPSKQTQTQGSDVNHINQFKTELIGKEPTEKWQINIEHQSSSTILNTHICDIHNWGDSLLTTLSPRRTPFTTPALNIRYSSRLQRLQQQATEVTATLFTIDCSWNVIHYHHQTLKANANCWPSIVQTGRARWFLCRKTNRTHETHLHSSHQLVMFTMITWLGWGLGRGREFRVMTVK